jgi:hypothetical protein
MAAAWKMGEAGRGLGERVERLSAVDGGALVAVCVAWLVVVLALGADLFGFTQRDMGFRWAGAGMLIGLTGILLGQFAQIRKWPHSHLRAVHVSVLVAALLGMALVITGVVRTIGERDSAGSTPSASG